MEEKSGHGARRGYVAVLDGKTFSEKRRIKLAVGRG